MILTAGLSPAWQQTLCFDSLQIGEVNRAKRAVWCASGKVINVAVAASSLGADVALVSALGGISGDIIRLELESFNVRTEWIETAAATRVCTTLLDAGGVTTELVENTADLEPAAIDEFISRAQIYANVADLSVFTGSLPANAPPDLFARILRDTHHRFILDLRGEPLQHCLHLFPFLIKPNREELQRTLQQDLTADDDLLRAMRMLNEQGVRWVVVSDGARGVWVTSREVAVRMTPPRIEAVNPIGCGDCLSAGIARELEYDDDVIAAVRFGMGAAANNAEQLLPARLNIDRSTILAEQVTIQGIADRGES